MKKGSIDPVISILMAATIAVSAFSFSANYSVADTFLTDESSDTTMIVIDEEAARESFVNFFGAAEETTEAEVSEEIEVIAEETEEATETAVETTVPETEAEETEEIAEAAEETEEIVETEAETAATAEETVAETAAETAAETEAPAPETAEQTEPEVIETVPETIETEPEIIETAEETEAVVETAPEETVPAETEAEAAVVEETEAPAPETTVETTEAPAPAPVVVYPPAGTVEYQILVLVNNARAAEGLAPLSWSDGLAGAAAVRASEIVVLFDHTRPDGSSCYTVSDLVWAENIACGQPSAEVVFNDWMNSPGHRANIMAPDYTTMGVALYANGDGVYNYYWAQEFGY